MRLFRYTGLCSFALVLLGWTSAWACGSDNGQGRAHRYHSIISTSDACEMTSETVDMISSRGRYESHGLDRFVESSSENITSDIARGGGEYLSALAVLLHVPTDMEAAFFADTQHRYPVLSGRDLSSDGLAGALRTLAARYMP